MLQELVTIQVGQCGNQIGHQYWNTLAKEHSIDADNKSEIENDVPIKENKGIFFYQGEDQKYTPRAVLIDLEPRVINSIQNSSNRRYNSDSIIMEENGGGAGNIWASGYTQAREMSDRIEEVLDKEADSCDQMEGFQLIHSVAGGTGSGVGSFILELLSDQYPKSVLKTFSVFPTSEDGNEASDIVVQPYNIVLSLKRLALEADAVTLFDNTALNRIAVQRGKDMDSSLGAYNDIAANAMANCSASSRFPGYTYNDLKTMVATLVPTPISHFLSTSITPIVNTSTTKKKNVLDIMRSLLNPGHIMCDGDWKNGAYIANINIIRGESVDPRDINKALRRIEERRMINFVPWAPASIQVFTSYKSNQQPPLSGCSMANNTGVRAVFERTLKQYERLMRRQAFVDQFRRDGLFEDNLNEFYESQETVQNVIDEYKIQESLGFVESWRDVDI